MNRTMRSCVLAAFVVFLIAGTSQGQEERKRPQWFGPVAIYPCPFESGQNAVHPRVACLGEAVHAVWQHVDRIFWCHAAPDMSWSKPAVISGKDSAGSPDLVSDGRRLHAIWRSSGDANITYRYFDGKKWSTIEKLLKTRQSIQGPTLAVSFTSTSM